MGRRWVVIINDVLAVTMLAIWYGREGGSTEPWDILNRS